jgi:hypothetical protein
MKVKDIIIFHKEKYNGKEIILLDENSTFFNIRLYIKEKYPNIPIQIVNEGRGKDENE